MAEGTVQAQIRQQAPFDRVMLWRNNSGALKDIENRLIRFGLGNDSKAVNKKFKSGDLIGLRLLDGRFVSVEVKEPGARTDRDRLTAQMNWMNLVISWVDWRGLPRRSRKQG